MQGTTRKPGGVIEANVPLKLEPGTVRLSDRAGQYLKDHVLRNSELSNPANLTRFSTILFSFGMFWTDPDGVRRSRGPHYCLAELDISKLLHGYILRFDKNQFVAFFPEKFVPEPKNYSIDVVDDEIMVHPY